MAKMKCENCRQEILEDNPAQCPYCYSKNLIPISERLPDELNQLPLEMVRASRKPVSGTSSRVQMVLGVAGLIFLILGISLILYGGTQPANLAISASYGNPSQVNGFSFAGIVLAVAGASCGLIWLMQRFPRHAPAGLVS
jgi:DNA-directed RNA polymerase subunit RPC12/RpoP